MKRTIISSLAGGLFGIAVGFALGIFIYPFWFLTDVAAEEVANREQRTVVASGTFVHVNPSDPVHWGKGDVTVFDDAATGRLVHLEPSFEVGPGPRFHVYLVAHAKVRSKSDFENTEKVDLGRLKAFKGSQNYAVPPDVQLAAYRSVVIWCKEFGVLISPASLAAAPVGQATS